MNTKKNTKKKNTAAKQSRKSKQSNRVIREFNRRVNAVEEIMSYTLEGLIHEIKPLFTALYLSAIEETIEIWKRYPNNSEIKYIVGQVYLYHSDMKELARAVKKGFFEQEVRYLLNVASSNSIAGARFVPIFCTALEHAAELGLSAALCDDLNSHIKQQKRKDGFVITSTENGRLTIHSDEF